MKQVTSIELKISNYYPKLESLGSNGLPLSAASSLLVLRMTHQYNTTTQHGSIRQVAQQVYAFSSFEQVWRGGRCLKTPLTARPSPCLGATNHLRPVPPLGVPPSHADPGILWAPDPVVRSRFETSWGARMHQSATPRPKEEDSLTGDRMCSGCWATLYIYILGSSILEGLGQSLNFIF